MSFSAFLFQALNGLSTASGLFFIAAGLSLIFGVTRIVNIAHGSLYMLGTYIAYSLATKIGGGPGARGRARRRSDRDPPAATDLPCARAVSITRHICTGSDHQRRDALPMGPGGPTGTARARVARRYRRARPPFAEL